IDRLHKEAIKALKKELNKARTEKKTADEIDQIIESFVNNLTYKKPDFDFLDFIKNEEITTKEEWNKRWVKYLISSRNPLQYKQDYPETDNNEKQEEKKARAMSFLDELLSKSL